MSGTSGVNLGTAYGRIILDASGARSGADEAEQSLRQKIEGMGTQIRNLGANLTVLTAPIAAFGVAGVKAATSFDDAMRELQARTGLTTGDMDRMRQAALDMGATTAYSATDAANGLLQLTTSGLSADEALKVLPRVMDLAAASGEDLGNTADWVTDIMAAYNLPVDKAGEVTEALNAAAGSSSATVGDLALGFQNVGGAAALMGLSVDDTAAILATFSENGIKGAEAGTALRSMLNHMTSDVPEVTAMWDSLGVSLYDIEGNARPLNDVIQDLNTSMDGMSDQERVNTIQTLAGSYGQLGLNALLTSGGFDTMATSMDGAASAADVAQARMGGWSGALETLKGSVETLQITALTPFLNNVMTPLVNKITDVVNGLTDWATQNPELAGTMVSVLAGLAILGPALLIIGSVISSVTAIVGLLGTAFTALTGPVGLAILAGAGLVLAYTNNFGGLRDFIDGQVLPKVRELLDTLGTTWETTIVPAIETGVTNVTTYLQGLWTNVQPSLDSLRNAVETELLPAFQNFFEGPVQGAIQTFQDLLAGIWAVVQPGLQSLADWFSTTALPGIVDFVTNTVVPGLSGFVNLLTNLWTQIEPGLTSLVGWFTGEALPGIIDFVTNTVVPGIETFRNILRGIWLAVQPHLDDLKRWFDESGMPAIQTAIDTVSGIITGFRDTLAGIWGAVEGPLGNLLNGLRPIFDAIMGVIGPVLQAVKDLIEGLNLLGQSNMPGTGSKATSDIGGGSMLITAPRALGGPVSGGLPYLVGEQGPELFVPRGSGSIVPNEGLRGMGGTTIHIDVGGLMLAPIQGSSPQEQAGNFVDALEAELGRRGW